MARQMLSITTPAYSDPSRYELSNIARSTITEPTDVLIKVHASSINPIDVKKASGAMKLVLSDQFPYQIGYDCSGIITEVGSAVKKLKVGDRVFARFQEADRGTWSEYAKCSQDFVAHKPTSLSFGDAASLPLAAMTALQGLRKYKGSLEGKTVFIPAGLSGTGAFACQLAKNVFKAGKVITTVSTKKIDQVPKLLGDGVVDQIIDYTKNDPLERIPRGSVDFILDTTGQSMQFLSLMTPRTSTIASISTSPSGRTLQASNFMRRADNPQLPWMIRIMLDVGDSIRQFRAGRWGVNYEYYFVDSNAEDLQLLGSYVEKGDLKPVVGSRVDFHDIEMVREACWQVYNGKGGIGKTVIEIVKDD